MHGVPEPGDMCDWLQALKLVLAYMNGKNVGDSGMNTDGFGVSRMRCRDGWLITHMHA